MLYVTHLLPRGYFHIKIKWLRSVLWKLKSRQESIYRWMDGRTDNVKPIYPATPQGLHCIMRLWKKSIQNSKHKEGQYVKIKFHYSWHLLEITFTKCENNISLQTVGVTESIWPMPSPVKWPWRLRPKVLTCDAPCTLYIFLAITHWYSQMWKLQSKYDKLCSILAVPVKWLGFRFILNI